MTASHGSTEDQIRALEAQRYQAMLAGDSAILDALLADELTYTHSNATRDTKQSYVEKVSTGLIDYQSIDGTIETVTVIGDSAVTHGQMRAAVITAGRPAKLNTSTLSVWVRRDGDWRLLAYQPTVNPPSDA